MERDLITYQRALFLRKKKGYSYNEIQEELTVAKSTLSNWLSEIELSKKQKARIHKGWLEKIRKHNSKFNLGEWNRKKRQLQVTKIRIDAKRKFSSLSGDSLFIAGIMLYWAEGNKTNCTVGVSNADPAFVKLIMYWFRNCIHIEEKDFRASVHYHQGQSIEELSKFWSNLTRIPLDQFRKGFCKPPGTGHRKHYLQHGTLQIRICKSGDLLHKIMGWKDGLIEDVISVKQKGRP